MDRREAARSQLNVDAAYRHWHDHAQFDRTSQDGKHYWGRPSPTEHAPIGELEARRAALRNRPVPELAEHTETSPPPEAPTARSTPMTPLDRPSPWTWLFRLFRFRR
ncbi:MAG: hypothetical protein AAGI08_05750 [Bacteroidota bacterium]